MRPIIATFTYPWQRARGSALYDSVLAHRRKELAELDLASSDALLEEWTMVVTELDASLRLNAKCDAMGIGIVPSNGRGMGGRQRSRSFLGSFRREKKQQQQQQQQQVYRGLDRSLPVMGDGGLDVLGELRGGAGRQVRSLSRSFHSQPARQQGGAGQSLRQGMFAPQPIPTEASKVRRRTPRTTRTTRTPPPSSTEKRGARLKASAKASLQSLRARLNRSASNSSSPNTPGSGGGSGVHSEPRPRARTKKSKPPQRWSPKRSPLRGAFNILMNHNNDLVTSPARSGTIYPGPRSPSTKDEMQMGAGAALGRVAAAISPAARCPQPTQMKLYVKALLSDETAARDSASLALHVKEKEELIGIIGELQRLAFVADREKAVLRNELASVHTFLDKILPTVIETCPDVLHMTRPT